VKTITKIAKVPVMEYVLMGFVLEMISYAHKDRHAEMDYFVLIECAELT
jgi:hypothetical protein